MKVHFLTMVYCNAPTFRAGMGELARTADLNALDAYHWLLWQHYPLRGEQTHATLHKYQADNRRAAILDAGHNLGLHHGLNYMVETINPADDDVVIGFDPDEKPLRDGWAQAMVDIMRADPACGWLSLMSPPADEYMKTHGAADRVVAGHTVKVPGYSLINTVCAWSGRALKAMGPFSEPHAYYGGLEGEMMPKLMSAGQWIGWLSGYWVAPLHDLADPEYQLYKRYHVGFETPLFPGSFADWCRQRGLS